MGFEEQDRLNREHMANPQVGDYWHEAFTPICVVLGRDGDEAILCKRTKEASPNHWTWDLRQVERITLKAFAEWLSYKSESVKNKTWAWVEPGAHRWAREAAMADLLGSDAHPPPPAAPAAGGAREKGDQVEPIT